MNRRPIFWTASLAGLLMTIARAATAYTRYYDTDELEHLHAAWCTAQGQLIYRDFFEHHGPLLAWLLSPLCAWIASPEIALTIGRGAMLCAWALILGMTAQWVKPAAPRWGPPLAILFLLSFSTFSIKALELRPDVPAACCGVLVLWILARPLTPRSSALAGAVTALGVLFTPKILYMLGGAFIALAWSLRREPARRGAAIGAGLTVGFLAPCLAVLAYFASRHGLHAFIECCWMFNVHFRATFPAGPFLLASLRENPALWLLAGAGLASRGDGLIRRGAMVGWAFGLERLPVAYPQYYLFLAPLLAYEAALACERFLPKLKMIGARRAAAGLIAVGLLPGVSAQIQNARISNRTQLEEIRCVMTRTAPTDKVFDAWTGVSVFRPHAWYFWFIHDEVRAMLRPEYLERGCIQALADPRCKAFIWGDSFQALPEAVKAYARVHYQPAACGRLFIRRPYA